MALNARVANSKIVAVHISKVYTAKKREMIAMRDINIEILRNEFVGIVGPSGCGKSTLLRLLAGLDEPSAGVVQLNDKVLRGPGPDLGMVFQGYTLFPWMTVEKNIAFGLTIKKLPRERIKETVDRYLAIIGLTQFRSYYPKQLSGGMKQRVAIARALANSPEVLLMDEPFSALDPQTKSSMQLLLRQIWQLEKPTILFVTHDIEEAVFLSQRVYVMSSRPGTIKANELIKLPNERTLDLKDTPEFIAIRRQIEAILHDDDGD
ncbi:MAG: ABC transporter ATP-binding protein [Spirochaetaceae bacterium]|nr:ABC transporter ATP-binding protein [Spirochaetaceae bacterium]